MFPNTFTCRTKHWSASFYILAMTIGSAGQQQWYTNNHEHENNNNKLDKFLIYRGMEIYLHWHGFINYLNIPIFRPEDLTVQKNVTVLEEIFKSVGMTPPRRQDVLAFLNHKDNKKKCRRLLEEQQSSVATTTIHRHPQLKLGGDQHQLVKMQLHRCGLLGLTCIQTCEVVTSSWEAILHGVKTRFFFQSLSAVEQKSKKVVSQAGLDSVI
jgi:hypothetical protein